MPPPKQHPHQTTGGAAVRVGSQRPGKSGWKGGGKGEGKSEKRSRTVYFGDFEEDTKGELIEEFVQTWTKDYRQKIEEVYSIGRIGERGAARFKTEEEMREFLVDQRGKLNFRAGEKTVYASPDSSHDPDPPPKQGL